MSETSGRLMRGVANLLTALIVLNIVCIVLFGGILLGSFAFEDKIVAALARDNPAGSAPATVTTMRIVMLIGLLMVPLAHLLLTRLRAIVASVQQGDPFVAANARRLTAIAWALLGIQIVDLGFGILSVMSDLDQHMPWSFALTPWLAVLLLFVLARVFEHGSRMREELAATI
jgi:hypothetical protein